MERTPNFLTVLGLKAFQQSSKKSSIFLLSPAISLSQYVANPNNHLLHSCDCSKWLNYYVAWSVCIARLTSISEVIPEHKMGSKLRRQTYFSPPPPLSETTFKTAGQLQHNLKYL